MKHRKRAVSFPCYTLTGLYARDTLQMERAMCSLLRKEIDPMSSDPNPEGHTPLSDTQLEGDCPSNAPEGKSEVTRLRHLIATEYEAAQRGLSGLAQGTAKHAFITARMERIGVYGEQLATIVGEPEATRIICELSTETIK